MAFFSSRAASRLLVVVCALAGCAAESDAIHTVFDACEAVVLEPAGANTEQRASIRRAAEMWNERAGSALVVDDGVEAVEAVDGDAPRIPVRFEAASDVFHGFYDGENGELYINEGIDDDAQRAVTIAHELGHAFGLLHVEAEQRSVMNRGNTSIEPNRLDVDSLVSLWGACPAR